MHVGGQGGVALEEDVAWPEVRERGTCAPYQLNRYTCPIEVGPIAAALLRPVPTSSAVARLMLETASTPGTPATECVLTAGIELVPSWLTIA